ncbi:MAG: beta-lactamase family protein [Bacteroidales bacterium]|nr:beta-lactamase family protein [Bacteroidales bacterium]
MIAKLKLLILFSLLTSGLSAQNSIKHYTVIIDSLYSVFNESERPGCAIAVVKEEKIVYQKCFGLSDLEHKIPITNSTLFGLASVSKQFTGYGIAKLIKEKRVHPNFEIAKYLRNQNKLWDSIQVRNLIHHTSGIWEWPYLFLASGHTFNDVITHQYIYKIIKSQSKLNFKTGSEFQYGSSNYVLLGQLITNVTDTSYFDWINQNVFKPAGMTETVFQRSSADLINNRVYGYLYENHRYNRTTDNISPQGTGSVYSNLTDMITWTKYLLSEYARKNPLIIQMLETDTLNTGKEVPYAYGLMKRGSSCYWHDGVFQGFRNLIILYPEHNVGLVLLSNSGSNYIMRSAFSVAEMFVKDSVPREQINNYKKLFREESEKKEDNTKLVYQQGLYDFNGIYLNTELLITYLIHEQKDSLFAENSIEKILLKPIEGKPDEFNSSKLLLGEFIFERNESGEVKELLIKQKRGNIIRFIKIEGEQINNNR